MGLCFLALGGRIGLGVEIAVGVCSRVHNWQACAFATPV